MGFGVFAKIILASICVATSASTVTAVERLNLKEALRYAIANSPELSSEQRRAEIRRAEVKSARSRFLPSLDLESTHGVWKGYPPTPTDPWSSAVSVRLTENLYDNHESINAFRIALLNEEYATLSANRARDKLVLDVLSEFYRYSLARHLHEARIAQLKILKTQLQSVSSHYRDGMRTRKDYLRFRTEVQRNEIDTRNVQVSAEQSGNELRRLLGATPDRPIQFAESAPGDLSVVPGDAPTPEGTYEFRLAKIQYDVTPIETYRAERKFWPQINLTTSVVYQNSSYLGSGNAFRTNENYYWNALVTLNFNLLDWGIRTRDIAIAQERQLIQENEVARTRNEMRATTESLILNLGQLKANHDSTRELLEAEQETYRTIEREYQEGKVAYLDMITSLKALLDARIQLLTVQFQLAEGLAKYHYYRGKLHETMAL